MDSSSGEKVNYITKLNKTDLQSETCPDNLPIWHIVKKECSVLDCNNSSSNFNMFAFPECAGTMNFHNKTCFDTCKKWLQACGNENLLEFSLIDLYKNAFVCSVHFKEDQFQDASRKDLVPSAIPTLLLPDPMAAEKLVQYLGQFPAGEANKNLEVPVKQEAETLKVFGCTLCSKTFHDEDTLKRHLKLMHYDEGPLECTLCDKTFLRGCDYKRHYRIHTTKLRHVCMECERCFPNKITYSRHLRASHSEGSPFYCAPCNRRFSSSGCLKSHLRIHTGVKPFACKLCDMRFFTKSSLKAHKLTHASKHCSCKVCAEIFPDQETLLSHFKEHEKEKPFACSKCSRRFSQHKHLRIHLRTHNGAACFKCKDCNKRCSSEQSLQLHMKSHLDDEPVICPHCHSKFSTLNRLVMHYCRSARGKRNVCPVCFKQFPSQSVLDIHMAIHDQREPDKPYACSVCYKRFKTKTRLDLHIYYQHDDGAGPRRSQQEEQIQDSKAGVLESVTVNGGPIATQKSDSREAGIGILDNSYGANEGTFVLGSD